MPPQLLHKETKLLQTIDRLKISANHENRDRRIASTLYDPGPCVLGCYSLNPKP